ncbi:unnamed protein product [Clonostachys byssicola]|uniref:Phytanoyl-CoA dioxygenase n=1 Tax=Clonostachys byssicola TaxID=160290 RepID=A0A9N9Y4D5_9HYPO|nr:unnamed protein product [Clonostachys byssicola]
MEIKRLSTADGAEAIVKAMEDDGMVIITDFITKDQIDRLNADLEPELAKMKAGKPDGMMDYYEEIDAAYGLNTKRLLDVPTFSKAFRDDIIEIEIMHQVSERVFKSMNGDDNPSNGYWLNSAQVIEIGPGNDAQALHRDQEMWPLWNDIGPNTPEAVINFFFAITPSTDLNGATRLVPGSHKWPKFESSLEKGILNHDTVPGELNPGECLLFSGKLLHGGGANRSQKDWRRCFSLSICRMGLMPEQAHCLLMPIDVADTMTYRGQAMHGFRSMWPTAHGRAGYYWTKDYEDVGQHIGLKDKPLYPEKAATTA